MGALLRYVLLALAAAFLAMLAEPFFSELLRRMGVDTSQWVEPIVAQVSRAGFQLLAASVLGATAGAWAHWALTKREGEAPRGKMLAAQYKLSELFKEAVAVRNRLEYEALPDFDENAERASLQEWQERTLAQMKLAGVTVPVQSRFETLNKFQPKFLKAPGKIWPQEHLEGIWNEKIRLLRNVIDSFDSSSAKGGGHS